MTTTVGEYAIGVLNGTEKQAGSTDLAERKSLTEMTDEEENENVETEGEKVSGAETGGALPEEVSMARILAACIVGNILEWYDFAIFGFFTLEIGELFFPGDDPFIHKIETFAVFGGAFLMRPIGGIIMGHIGDTFGRKRALEISIILMLIPSTTMGCMPTYHQIGVLSTVLVVLLRLIQGVACGGELVGSMLYIVECTTPERRGLIGAIAFAGANAGTLIAAFAGASIRSMMSEELVLKIGWRICFWLGFLAGVAGILLRRGLKDSAMFEEAKEKGETVESPLKTAIKQSWREILVNAWAISGWPSTYYLCFVWIASFEESAEDVLIENPYWVIVITNIAMLFTFAGAGHLSDIFSAKRKLSNRGLHGRLDVMSMGSIFMIIIAIPTFMFIKSARSTFVASIVQLPLSLGAAAIGAPMSVWFYEGFTLETRYTSTGIAYNLAQALLGGTTPLIATLLAGKNYYLPAVYLIVANVFSLSGQTFARFYFPNDLHSEGRGSMVAPLSVVKNVVSNEESSKDDKDTAIESG